MQKTIAHIKVERHETETVLRIPNRIFDSLEITAFASVSYVEYDDHVRIWRAPLDGYTGVYGEVATEPTDAEEEEEADLRLFREMPNDFDDEEWVWDTDK